MYTCVSERVTVGCPLLCKIYQTHLPPALIYQSYVTRVFAWRSVSELHDSRVFAWRSEPRVRCVRVLQQQYPLAALCTVTHTHTRMQLLIMQSAPPRQMLLFTLQRTTYEHPLGDIRRLKAQVAGNIVRHVTAGDALSVADLQGQHADPGGSPPLRLLMGQRAHFIESLV